MRPGQSCPGVARRLDVEPDRATEGFNEAGAIMPRSGVRLRARSYGDRRCFNEAGAIMPRSGFRSSINMDFVVVASMRPGQSCPGVVRARCSSRRREYSFNEAGAIMPRSGYHRQARPRASASRFNEAGAIMPRSGCSIWLFGGVGVGLQ